MSDENTVEVRITAQIADLQSKLALAQENFRQARTEMQATAAEMSKLGVTADTALKAKLADSAAATAAARIEVAGLAKQLQTATAAMVATNEATSGMKINMSAAAREGRALFDELSSGRTRMVPGTLAIIAQRVFGLQASTLLAVGGVVGLVGALGYLAVKAIEAAHAVDSIKLGAEFANNMDLSKEQINLFVDQLTRMGGMSQSEAEKVVGSFARIKNETTPLLQLLTADIGDYAAASGQDADKASEALVKSFQDPVKNAKSFVESISGATQAEIDNAEAASRTGNANQAALVMFEALDKAIARTRQTQDEHNSSMFSSVRNMGAYIGLTQSGMSYDEIYTQILAEQNAKRKEQADLIIKSTQAMREQQNTPQQTLQSGTAAAAKEDNATTQLAQVQGRIDQITAALEVAKQAGDQTNVDKLDAGLKAAQQHLDELKFGPIMEQARAEITRTQATWDGTESGLLAKENEVWTKYLAKTREGSTQHLQILQEMDRNEASGRKEGGNEAIAQARLQISEVNAEEAKGSIEKLQVARQIWDQLLAGDKLTAAQRVSVEREKNQSIATLEREQLALKSAIGRADTEADIQISQIGIAAKRNELQNDLLLQRTTAAQKYEILQQLTQQEFQLDIERLENERSAYAAGTLDYARYTDQIRVLRAKLNADLAALDKQYTIDEKKENQERLQGWKSASNEILSSEDGAVRGLLQKNQTLNQALLNLGANLVEKEISQDLQYVTKKALYNAIGLADDQRTATGGILVHALAESKKTATVAAGTATRTTVTAAGEAAQTGVVAAGEAVQTGAVVAGTTARVAAQETGASEGLLISAATALKQVAISAYQAAASAYAAISAIPYVGPFLAPAAAALALGAVFAIGKNITSSEGGDWNVGSDRLNLVHKNETILPASVAGPMRNFFSGGAAGRGGGGGDTYNLTVQAMDTQTGMSFLMNNGGGVVNSMRRQQRLGNQGLNVKPA
jgi:hypothetical protein